MPFFGLSKQSRARVAVQLCKHRTTLSDDEWQRDSDGVAPWGWRQRKCGRPDGGVHGACSPIHSADFCTRRAGRPHARETTSRKFTPT